MPSAVDQTGRAKYVAGEMCETLTDHWGAADDINYKSVKTLIEELCECRKVGANFLLNIGPNADGSVPTMQRGTMECIGHWMKVYGKAIYNGRPFLTYTDTRDFWLRDVEDEKTAYLFRFDPGRASGDKNVSLSFDSESAASFTDIPNEILSAKWMDSGENILFEQTGSVAKFNLLGYSYGQSLCVRVAEIKFK
jgi:alpha-L-fucosidase